MFVKVNNKDIVARESNTESKQQDPSKVSRFGG